ncbi:DMT family transporter [Clostridium sp. C2-6-12]|uniref:DMT family transporter n=1 Tax=Clostridium sp. C2-6-12 TaxID=2698832 RepID=UPI0013716A40|nr:DMT family transporter [Clostridium sp. C2-6-12]
MIHSYIGELAALATAICWTLSPIAFEYSGKEVGSLSVNYIRLIIAFVFIGIYTLFTRGMFLPMDATATNWIWLLVSGIIGFVIGDLFLFEAYVLIGARLSMLIMATVPILSAIADYIIVGQKLTIVDVVGMLVTIYGIAIVILVKNSNEKSVKLSKPIKGFFYAFMGALGQAMGLIFSKVGMGNYDAFAATQIRTIAGIIGFSIIITYSNAWGKVFSACKKVKVMKYITLGSFFGPFLGVSFSLLALQYTATGIASTIMSISRIIIIPFSIIVFREAVTKKEIVGAVISIVGVGILFL